MTDTDCGVLAFVLAGELQTVVDKLVGKERSAYVEGRFVGMGARLVIDICEYCMESGGGGLLLFLDFEKAFDAVGWSFLFQVLRQFSFGGGFISWVGVLYTGPVFGVEGGGWISGTCRVGGGVGQGCPVSALLCLFVAGMLACGLRHNSEIRGVGVSGMVGAVEAVRRADGVALALRSVSPLDVAVETVGEFCKRAGSGVDVGKTRLNATWWSKGWMW